MAENKQDSHQQLISELAQLADGNSSRSEYEEGYPAEMAEHLAKNPGLRPRALPPA
ncbi:Uncharacterised protein [Mycobacteroides abscessus subsp. abscessus]|jgi:hypothetical protein|uniref:hypothetical protein n=1 Tax=Mycobacteroides abscessus TaxID=36809 RepID=UPI000927A897|nr:hypothetical protein [Mycobacteroides abscessus]SIH23282.1 Uncharacterised protein [Mycobacteroides abscessus subsp. abscessus]